MAVGVAKLKKLTNLHELRVRGWQELSKVRDRMLNAHPTEMSDEALYKAFTPAARNGSGIGTAALLLHRLQTKSGLFLPALTARPEIVATMRQRFPSECAAILASAEKACAGKFDLLGYDNLDFGTPIDWHLEPRTGKRTPMVHWSQIDPVNPVVAVDPKIVWELNRHSHFVTLAQAYWLTAEQRYVQAFVEQVHAWIDANPVGIGINWASAIEAGFRAVVWLWALHWCADSQWVTPQFVSKIVKSLLEQGRHVEKYLSTYFSPNTHLTGEALGLLYIGLALPELRVAEHWRKLGLRILLEQLPRHVRTDGVYFEQSSYYHRYTTDFYLHLHALLRANDLRLPDAEEQLFWQKLELLYEHLLWIQRPDGTSPLFGDDDGGRLLKLAPRASNNFRDTLATGVVLFARGDWKYAAGAAPVELLWLFGVEGLQRYDKVNATPPAAKARAFATSGYFVLRSGWEREASSVLLDCGRHGAEAGAGHAHSDVLSLEFAARGTTWIVDPGTFIYGADAATRNWFRSTEAHNTVMVDAQPQSQPGVPFAWRTQTDGELVEFKDGRDWAVVEGQHNGYASLSDPVIHSRTVLLLREKHCLFVTDKFTAQATHTYTLRFHLTPACTASVVGNRIAAHTAQGEQLTIIVFVAGKTLSKVQARIEDGWVSSCYGQRQAAPVVVFEVSSTGVTEVVSVLVSTCS
jgi:hypothetical protein